MAKVDVLDLNGKKVGSVELADEVFGVVNEDLLWEAVKHYRAGQRSGTHATKNKKLVSGAGKKLWRQKGTSFLDRKSTRLNSSHPSISYAVFCMKKKQSSSLISHCT